MKALRSITNVARQRGFSSSVNVLRPIELDRAARTRLLQAGMTSRIEE